MSPEFIVALSALVTAILTWIASQISSKRQARKDAVDLLREEVSRLHARIAELERLYRSAVQHNAMLLDYIAKLRNILISSGLEVPPMPPDLDWSI